MPKRKCEQQRTQYQLRQRALRNLEYHMFDSESPVEHWQRIIAVLREDEKLPRTQRKYQAHRREIKEAQHNIYCLVRARMV